MCVVCGRETALPPAPVAGLKGDGAALAVRVCSPECAEAARRFAARRSAQIQPSLAGMLVAGLGVIAAGLFVATGRDLGRALLVLSVFGAGTTRLAYPDALPAGLARRFGIARATEMLQWLGVVLCVAAIALAVKFVLF